jgi:uncharacterized membrane protein
MSDAALSSQVEAAPPIDLRNLLWVALALAVMVAAIASGQPWFLNFVHVMAGALWTGIDLFMGFVLGPILRKASFEARRAVAIRLLPKTIFLMPTLAIITGTSGYFHARQLGFMDVPTPQFYWVAASLVVIAILTVQGLGILLPTNFLVYFEMRKEKADRERIGRLMQRYIYAVSFQGLMQVTILVLMAKFATGL